jgi:hypothetical protein
VQVVQVMQVVQVVQAVRINVTEKAECLELIADS